MFQATKAPPLLSEMGLQALCPSLNSPEVRLEDLPAGPARAAIVLYAEEYGQLRLAVGVRSLGAGQTVIYVHRGDLNEYSSTGTALESALNFAEDMGFLFDEDIVERGGPAGRARAFALWQELVAGMAPAASEQPAPPPTAPAGDGLPDPTPLAAGDPPNEELLLEEVAELDVDGKITRRGGSGSGRAASDQDEPRALSKFRSAEKPVPQARTRRSAAPKPAAAKPTAKLRAAAAKPGSGGNELGRIPLVRRRLGAEVAAKPGWLMRLLGSF